MRRLRCKRAVDGGSVIETLCARCGEAAMRPDVVWFGEMPREMERIYEALGACDLFISIGTSGTVYPAAGFVMEARAGGAHAVELNLEPSDGADLFLERIEGPATEIVPAYVSTVCFALSRRVGNGTLPTERGGHASLCPPYFSSSATNSICGENRN